MKVELVSVTRGIGKYAELDNEQIIAAVARHGKIKEDGGELVRYLMDNKHWSPLQHISFSFLIETSRAISAQIFRHRSLNFQETSQRYEQIMEFEDVEIRRQADKDRQSSEEVFDPKVMFLSEGHGLNLPASEIIDYTLNRITEVYKALLKAGVAKECARMILPMCSKTTIHVTGTFRDLLAFLNIRCDAHAQKEVQLIAQAMGEAMEKEMPSIMGAIDWRNGLFL